MSTARGRGAPRARGSGQRGGARGTSTARGASFTGAGQRGNTARGGVFGQASRGSDATRGRGATTALPKSNGFNFRGPQPSPGAFGNGPSSRDQWSQRNEALIQSRAQERQQAIRNGLLADPDKPRSLADAITLVGTCQDMCAEYERVERTVQNDVWEEEEDQSDGHVYNASHPRPVESRMVKKFRRAAAGLEEQLPSDLRPPAVLKRTCDFLFEEVVPQMEQRPRAHHFIWDRTRAIRNDFSIQQLTKLEDLRIAIECYERIARFHILSLHQLALQPKPYDAYDAAQEREQLDRTLLSLLQYYDDCRGRIDLPNEAEFRAYCVIFQLQDPTPDLEDRVQSWPSEILQDQRVRVALQLYAVACETTDPKGPFPQQANHLVAQQDWWRFWTLVESKQVSYLMGCVAEIYFNLVRRMTLNAIWRAYRTGGNAKSPVMDWTVDALMDVFALDDEDHVTKFCNAFGFSFGQGINKSGEQVEYLELHSVTARELPSPDMDLPKQWKSMLVEDKRFGRTWPSIINGMTVVQAQRAGLVVEEEREEEMGDAMDELPLQEDVKPTTNGYKGPFEEENDDAAPEDASSLFITESRKPSQEKANGFATLTNGAEVPAAKTNGFTFGGASTGFTFGAPSTTTFGKPSTADVNATAAPPATGVQPDEAPKKGPFNFGSPSSTTPSTAALAAQPPAPETPTPDVEQPPKSTASGLFSFGSNSAAEPPAFTPATFSFSGSNTKSALSSSTGSVLDPAPTKSIFNNSPPPVGSPKQVFTFGTSGQPAAKPNPGEANEENKSHGVLPAFKPAAAESAPALPDKPFTFGAVAPPADVAATPSPEVKAEPKSPQPHFTPPKPPLSPPAEPVSSIDPQRRVSLNTNNWQPKKKSPLSQSYGPDSDGSAVNGVKSISESPNPANQLIKANEADHPSDPRKLLEELSDNLWGDESSGILNQYLEFTIGQAITELQDQVAAEISRKQADEFRSRALSLRYCKRWKETLWRKMRSQRGSARRERARKGLEEMKSGRSAFSGSRRSSVAGAEQSEKERIDKAFQQTIRNGQRPSFTATGRQAAATGGKRPLSSQGPAPSTMREPSHKRQKSTTHVDERGRVAKPSTTAADSAKADLVKRSSFLGFSLSGDASNQGNTVRRSNYFRLKAMGINPGASTIEPRGVKRGREESTGAAATASPAASSRSSLLKPRAEQPRDASMPPPAIKSRNDDADEALFARLKAAREGLAETASLMKSDMEREEKFRKSYDELGRSQSSMSGRSQGSNDSPSLQRARVEARWRASQGGSAVGTPEPQRDVPAYRLRESRFVPKNQYGKAIERAREMRESRSRDTSRPQSRFDDARFDESPDRNLPDPANTISQPFQPALESHAFGTQAAQESNESLYPSLTMPESQPFSSVPQQQPSWSMDNFQTQQSQAPPEDDVFSQPAPVTTFSSLNTQTQHAQQQSAFGQTSTVKPFGSFNTETQISQFPHAFGETSNSQQTASPFGWTPANATSIAQSNAHDFTIKPSQIGESLSNSFGHGQAQSLEHQLFQHAQQQSPTPQPDSYQHTQVTSEVVSLLSDDDEDEPEGQPPPPAYATHLARQAMSNGFQEHMFHEQEEMLDNEQGELANSYQYTNPNANNPYAALGSDFGGGDTEEDVDEGTDEVTEDDEGAYEDGEQQALEPNGYYQQNGYEDEDDMEGDGDIEDAEDYDEEDEEEEGQNGGRVFAGHRYANGSEQEEYSEEYDEDDEETQGELFVAPKGVWNQPVPKNPALEGVGGTAEEAIELSD